MKVGQIFTLPPDILYPLGHIGKLKNDDETEIIAKYEVVEIEGELKGKVIVTYGHGGARERRHHNNKGYRQVKNGRTRKGAKRLAKKYIKNA